MSETIRNKPHSERMTTALHRQLSEGLVVAAGCYDAYSARLAEVAGFKALHLSGMCVEITRIGAPDLGIMTLTELAAQAAAINSAVNIPMIADVDTGFGGVLNVNRTIREMERAGVAGVHIEDQTMPKHCPLLAGRSVMSRGEAIEKIKAACDARSDPDFVIVARTDADVISFKEVIERANLYLEAGADMVMPLLMVVDGVPFYDLSPDERMKYLRLLRKEINGPVMGMGEGAPPGYTSKDMAEAGYNFISYTAAGLAVSGNAMAEVFASILKNGTEHVYYDAHPGLYNNALEQMKLVHLDKYGYMESLYTK